MFEPSKETRVLLATFMAVSAGAVAGCSGEESDSLVSDDTSYQRLKDDSGKEYTLIKNGDGTETAKYDNGESVTFKRDDDGNLNVVAGTAGLLAGLGAGYFLWHGLNPSGAHFDSYTNSYRPSSSVSQDIKKNGWKKYEKEKDKNAVGKTGGTAAITNNNSSKSTTSNSASSTKSNSTTSTSKPAVTSQSKSTTPSTKSSVSGAGSTKSGFGGAGARSAAS